MTDMDTSRQIKTWRPVDSHHAMDVLAPMGLDESRDWHHGTFTQAPDGTMGWFPRWSNEGDPQLFTLWDGKQWNYCITAPQLPDPQRDLEAEAAEAARLAEAAAEAARKTRLSALAGRYDDLVINKRGEVEDKYGNYLGTLPQELPDDIGVWLKGIRKKFSRRP